MRSANVPADSFRGELRSLLQTAGEIPNSIVTACLEDVFLKGKRPLTCRKSLTSACVGMTNVFAWCSVLAILFRVVLHVCFCGMTLDRLYDKYTYPGLRTARLLALPLLNRFPSLAYYHDRRCLIPNPFFSPMNESECWPCENLKAIVDLTGHPETAKNYVWSLVPFVVKDALRHNVSGQFLHSFLKAHKELTEDTTGKFVSTLYGVHEPRHLLDRRKWQQVDDQSFHITWQLASPPAARILRKVFHRPHFVQNISEVSLQRFLLFDGCDAPTYYLPETDFSSSWLVQVEGSRLVVLEPSELCVRHCRLVSVLLRPNDILYFSSTISRARSIPAHLGELPSIAYLGSFY